MGFGSIARRGAGAAIRIGLAAGVVAALGWASTASAGDVIVDPSVSASAGCQQGQGVITVTVTNGTYPVIYDITIDGVLRGAGVPQGSYTYGPYAAGNYPVAVDYTLFNEEPGRFFRTVTVPDCRPAPTTTSPPTTAAPTTAAPTTAAPTTAAPTTAAPTTAAPTTAVGSGAASPTLPATGQTSDNLVLTAVLLIAAGGALVLIVRQARRA